MNSHARFLKLGVDKNPIFATQLLNSYAIAQYPNSLAHARQLFDEIPLKDTTLWNSIISAYTRSGDSQTALKLFSQMLSQTTTTTHQTQPNHFIYSTVAHACGVSTLTHHLKLGKTIHGSVIKTGYLPNVVVETSLLDMYAKWGIVGCARKVFDEMPERNVISWNAMIAAYVLNEMEYDGLEMFYRMKCVEFEKPDGFSAASVLGACSGIDDLELGMQVHCYLVVSGFEAECVNAISSMYFRCGEVSFAEKVLKGEEENSLLKLLMIKGYVVNERYYDALKLVAYSNFVEIVAADCSVTISVLTACADLSMLRIGKQVHGLIITLLGYPENSEPNEDAIVTVINSALISMYCKCSNVREARKVFDTLLPTQHVSLWNSMITGYINNGLLENAITCFEEMPKRNVVSWTLMISGYVQYGLPHEGIRSLANMYNNKNALELQGNARTFASAIEACSLLTVLDVGKQIHSKLIRTISNGDTENVVVGTALVDMYVKCGNLNYAETVFNRMEKRNVVSWTSMITGYAIHGLGSRVLEIFHQMIETGVKPNEITFVSLLTSCSHCGLVEEGLEYFKLMTEKYGLTPKEDHYSCVIDMFGRAGRLCEALELLERIENEKGSELNNGALSGAFLGACRLHENMEMGSKVAEKMIEMKQQFSETHIALYNIYAAAGLWDEAYKVRERWRHSGGVGAKPGNSSIYIKSGNSWS